MPMQFEYDPKGDVFTYFIISFGALILTPGTGFSKISQVFDSILADKIWNLKTVTVYKWSSSGVSKEQVRLNKLRDRHGNSRWFSAKVHPYSLMITFLSLIFNVGKWTEKGRPYTVAPTFWHRCRLDTLSLYGMGRLSNARRTEIHFFRIFHKTSKICDYLFWSQCARISPRLWPVRNFGRE